MSNFRRSVFLESDRIRKSKVSLTSKKSKLSDVSYYSQHGSTFGRAVAKFNRKNDPGLVHTLSITNSRVIPANFNPTLQNNSTFPDLKEIEGTTCIRELGKSLNIMDYEFNFISFWILDVLSRMIKELQVKNIKPIYQNKLLTWFRFVLQRIAVSAAPREEMFDTLQKVLESAFNVINEGKPIPDPNEIEKFNISKGPVDLTVERPSLRSSDISGNSNSLKSQKIISSNKTSQRNQSVSSKLSRTTSKGSNASLRESEGSIMTEEQTKENIQHFQTITKMLYQIFADRFVYTIIHKAFSSIVNITPVDIRVVFQDPKQLRPHLVAEPIVKATPPKKSQSPRKKSKDKGKKLKFASEVRKENIPKSKKKGKKSLETNNIKEEKETSKEISKGKRRKGNNKTKSSQDKKHSLSSSQGKKGIEGKIKSKSRKTSEGNKKLLKALSVVDNLENEKNIPLEEQIKLFNRNITKQLEPEAENLRSKNQFILPLLEAVDTNYVTNIINAITPQVSIPVQNVVSKTTKKPGEDKKKKSVQKGKNSPKPKKK